MNAATIQERITQQQQDCAALEALWRELIPSFCPSSEQFKLWLIRFGFETASYGVTETAAKRLRMGTTMSADHMLRFASRVMIDRAKKEN
jgi:hypothetical protein